MFIKETNKKVKLTESLLYIGPEGSVTGKFIVDKENETLWANRQTMAEIFNVTVENIRQHLKNIFDNEELNKNSVCKKILYTGSDGKKYNTFFYELDAIIAVGYRVNSKQGTYFRKWSNKVLKDFMIKGYVLDKELLKNDGRFGISYFDRLLEDIREIRASERKFNQKITDIYATSYDYDSTAEISKEFFATVQNKLIYAITGFTAAEIIANRSDSKKQHMGLTSWKNPNGKIIASDVVISKNYLNKKELDNLNRIVEAFLNIAEFRANNQIVTTMNDWKDVLNNFIHLNQLPILNNKGSIDAKKAKEIAIGEYEKFRNNQDREFQSDFDKMIEDIKRIEGEK